MNARPTVAVILAFGFASPCLAAEPPAASGKPPTRPRGDAFLPGLPGEDAIHFRRKRPPFKHLPAAFPDVLEVVWLANARPVRIRVTITRDGQPLGKLWDAHLRKLFAEFDRDRDGTLNRYEAEAIFPAKSLAGLLGGNYHYPGLTPPVAFADLDRDDDGRISFDEFAAGYADVASDLIRPRGVPTPTFAEQQLTHGLFAKLDRNGDGKLSREEMKQAERILLEFDSDDDECLSPTEIFADLYERQPATPPAAAANEKFKLVPDLQLFRGAVPGVVAQQLFQRYDRSGDFAFSREEIGFEDALFAKLDTNRDGKLSAAEIEAWRTGPADFTATLNLGATSAACTATLTPRGALPPRFEIRAGDAGRVVLRAGSQLLDLSATPPPSQTGGYANAGDTIATSFPENKEFVTEAMLAGPQYQFLRIVFDAADENNDGKLTRDEFDRYLARQRETMKLSLAVVHSTRTPNLFQLLDENGDGRLGIRELRTAFDRLIVLEPAGSTEVTKAAIQPSSAIRLMPNSIAGLDTANAATPFPVLRRANTKGPLWFIRMDRNGDGDVSRSEFLGTKEQFDALDRNGDGLISLDEALAKPTS